MRFIIIIRYTRYIATLHVHDTNKVKINSAAILDLVVVFYSYP